MYPPHNYYLLSWSVWIQCGIMGGLCYGFVVTHLFNVVNMILLAIVNFFIASFVLWRSKDGMQQIERNTKFLSKVLFWNALSSLICTIILVSGYHTNQPIFDSLMSLMCISNFMCVLFYLFVSLPYPGVLANKQKN